MTRPRGDRITELTTPRSISVVIPSYRRLDRLPALIRTYREQGADEIVIVLDGPHRGWELVLTDLPAEVRVIELPRNVGRESARAAGLAASGGDIILAVDDDIEPAADFVDAHRRFHAIGTAEVLVGYMPVSVPVPRGRDEAPTYLYARDYERQVEVWRGAGSTTLLRSLWGGNLSLPRELYLDAETSRSAQRLEYNEDLDLGLRLLALGARAHFDDSARAAHLHSRDLESFARECVVRGEAISVLEERWGEVPPQLLPLIVIPPGYRRVLGAAQRRIAAADTRGVLELLCVGAYRLAGRARLWTLQDGIARFLRRALAMRGYRTRATGLRRRSESSDRVDDGRAGSML